MDPDHTSRERFLGWAPWAIVAAAFVLRALPFLQHAGWSAPTQESRSLAAREGVTRSRKSAYAALPSGRSTSPR